MEIIIAILCFMVLVFGCSVAFLIHKLNKRSNEAPMQNETTGIETFIGSLSQEQWSDFVDQPEKVSFAYQNLQLGQIVVDRMSKLAESHFDAAEALASSAEGCGAKKATEYLEASERAGVRAKEILMGSNEIS